MPACATSPQKRIYIIKVVAVEGYKWEQSTWVFEIPLSAF